MLRTFFLLFVALGFLMSCGSKDMQTNFISLEESMGSEGGNGDAVLDNDGIVSNEVEPHFDLTLFWNDGKSNWRTVPAYHAHAFDTVEPHLRFVDFLEDKKLGFHDAAEACATTMGYRIKNATKAAGEMELVIGGESNFLAGYPTFSAVMDGANEFEWVSNFTSSSVSQFHIKMAKFEILGGAKPSQVRKDVIDRAGAFSGRMFCGDKDIWEFAIYHHVK